MFPYFLDLYTINYVRNEHLLPGAMQFPVFNLERTQKPNGEAPQRGPHLGGVLFSQPVLLLVSPAGLHELAFTFLNLDTSSMDIYLYMLSV